MGRLRALAALFLKQLIRRKLLWVIVALLAGMMLINYLVVRQMDQLVGRGESYDVATRRAAVELESYAEPVRACGIVLVLLASALVAPASRKDGTTQFALSFGVSRIELAVAQFAALAVFVGVSVLILHVGYVIAALRVHGMSVTEAEWAWLWLLVPLLLLAAAVFALSLRWPAIVTYVIFLGIVFLAVPLVEAVLAHADWAKHAPVFVTRLVDNVELLYPKAFSLVLWPHLSPRGSAEGPPYPHWGWLIIHTLLSTAFWVALGTWAYLRHELGSRMPTK